MCVFLVQTLAYRDGSILRGLSDSSLNPLIFSLPIPVGGTQVAMTPDCFVCPLTSFRGAVVNQALHVRGKQQRRGKGGVHFF